MRAQTRRRKTGSVAKSVGTGWPGDSVQPSPPPHAEHRVTSLKSELGWGGIPGTPPTWLYHHRALEPGSGRGDGEGRFLRAGVRQLARDAGALAGSQHDAPAFIRGPAGLPGNYTTVKCFIH